MKKKTALIIISAASFLLCSCLGPKKIDKWVSQQYGGSIPSAGKNSNDFLTVTSRLPAGDNNISTTTKKTSKLLPLIFYWSFDYKNTCTLNPQIPVGNFTKTVMPYANKKGLKQKLNGDRVELTIDKIPNSFAIDDKGHIIWVIYAFGWDVLTIQPEGTELTVSYKVIHGSAVTKSGVITVTGSDKPVILKMYQSLKKRTWQYLDQYNASISSLSKLVVDRLVDELE